VPRFLSAEWVDALDRALSDGPAGEADLDGATVVIEQTVSRPGAEPVQYHLVLAPSQCSAGLGIAERADVRITTDYDTAARISRGELSGQAAFMSGRLRVGGDTRVLVEHGEALARLPDLFAAVRAETSYDDA
jgi:hypothetical protein